MKTVLQYKFLVAAVALFALIAAGIMMATPAAPVEAHPFPANCNSNAIGLGISASTFVVVEGNTVEYEVTVEVPSATNGFRPCRVTDISTTFTDPAGDTHNLPVIGQLDPGQSRTFTSADNAGLSYVANSDDAVNGELEASASTQGTAHTAPHTTARATANIIVVLIDPAIDIEKATNGEDADDPPGPTLIVGDTVTWTYEVTNIGDVPLSNVQVTDDQGVTVDCPQDTLDVGDSMTCTAEGTVEEGQYANVGEACGEFEGLEVCDRDPSHYFGEPRVVGDEGCTPGFWRQPQHFDHWTDPYEPDTLFSDVFGRSITVGAGGRNTITDPTLHEAVQATGGGISALARHAVAALLNAASPDVDYAFTVNEVITMVQEAIDGDRAVRAEPGQLS